MCLCGEDLIGESYSRPLKLVLEVKVLWYLLQTNEHLVLDIVLSRGELGLVEVQ